jgi:hypothetical protein
MASPTPPMLLRRLGLTDCIASPGAAYRSTFEAEAIVFVRLER